MLLRSGFIGLLILALGGCGRHPGPRGACAAYLAALARGDLQAAFGQLSSESRSTLARAERTWRSGEGRQSLPTALVPEDSAPGFALFTARMAGKDGLALPPLPADPSGLIQSVRSDGGRAWVSVSTPLGTRAARLVREDGDWKILLQL